MTLPKRSITVFDSQTQRSFVVANTASALRAFAKRLLVERSGHDHDVVKLMPPLNISEADMALGLDALRESVEEVAQRASIQAPPDTAEVCVPRTQPCR